MVREIIRDEGFLSLPSSPCSFPNRSLFVDLRDTLESHKDHCLGIAANMIGERKRAIALFVDGNIRVMFNPEIISKKGEYETEEGCLSLQGKRKTRRFMDIEVLYFDYKGREMISSFSHLESEVVQHEMDHLEGILI